MMKPLSRFSCCLLAVAAAALTACGGHDLAGDAQPLTQQELAAPGEPHPPGPQLAVTLACCHTDNSEASADTALQQAVAQVRQAIAERDLPQDTSVVVVGADPARVDAVLARLRLQGFSGARRAGEQGTAGP